MSWRKTIQEGKAPSWRDTISAEPEKDSKLRSLALGGAQGLSLGFADEIEGGARSLFGDGSYEENRDKARERYHKAENDNPLTYLAGNVGGSVPLALIPGAGTGASLGRIAAQGAAMGAASGLGSSEEKSLRGLAKDTALGAGIGAAVPSSIKGAGWLAKKGGMAAARATTQLPEDTVRRYIERNPYVKAARPLEDVARDAESSVGELANKVSKGSGESFGILNDAGTEIPRKNVVEAIMERVNKLQERGVYSPEMEREIKAIQGFAERVAGEGAADSLMPGARVKSLLQQIDESLGVLQKKSGDIPTVAQRELAGSRSAVDDMLKNANPAYREKMIDVSSNKELLERVNPRFGNKENALNNLKGIAREKSPFQSENLADMDAVLGKGLSDEARDAMAKDAFTKSTTNGSRQVNLGTALAGGAGATLGPVGAIAGYVMDTVARPATAKTIDMALGITARVNSIPGAEPFQRAIAAAAKKGPLAVVATHQLMMKNDANYRRAMEHP